MEQEHGAGEGGSCHLGSRYILRGEMSSSAGEEKVWYRVCRPFFFLFLFFFTYLGEERIEC